jgi:toxin FitB
MYLVDTNVISEARRRRLEAIAWLRSVKPSAVYLSVITIGEIARGIALKKRSDPSAAMQLSGWLQILRHDHAGRILPIGDEVAMEWGRLAAMRPQGDADGLIAATAIVHDLTLVTRNVADFDDLGVALLNPWDRA